MKACLTLEQLERIVTGPADPQGTALGSHLDSCPSCREKLEEIRTNLAAFEACAAFGPGLPRHDAAPAGASLPPDAPWVEGYDLLAEIHRGAQGVVYKATQHATHRIVALKVLLQGPYASHRQKRRFEREIDLVAGLEHPNIVRLYDSGQAAGRHYFAMQHIDGLRLGEYLAAQGPGLKARLRLFARVCHAVAYAHARGVMHRDLKPSNILVDRAGEPYVLDFGLAKPLLAAEGADSLTTRTGEFFGTLAYASPEQASCDPDAIDVRTDVYALGMILYELVTDGSPYPTDGSMSQMIRHIVETEPRRPSRSNRDLGDEIDTIVGKALEKDRDRRYQTVNALAADVERYLAGQPIEARPYSSLYVLKKTILRHKAAASLTAVVLASLMSLVLITTTYARRAARERDRAVVAERKARQAESIATKQAQAARRSLYLNRINLASAAFADGDIGRMRQMLEACPAQFRAWEWGRLRWLNDRSLLTFTGHAVDVHAVAFSLDGQWVASGDAVGRVMVWESATGKPILTLRAHDHPVRTVDFSPDRKRLVSVAREEGFRVWALPSGRGLQDVASDRLWTASFSPDGRRILTAADGVIAIRQASDSKTLSEIDTSGMPHPTRAGFSSDGRRIVAVFGEGEAIREYDAGNGKLVAERPCDRPTFGIAATHFFPAGARGFHLDALACGVRLVDDASGAIKADLWGHVGTVRAVDVSADGKRIVTASEDDTCRIWDASAPGDAKVWQRPTFGVRFATFSPDGNRIATAEGDGTVRIWDAERVGEPLLTLRAHASPVTSVAFSPDGGRIVSAPSADDGADLALRVWDASTGRQLVSLNGHTEGTACVAFLPDSKRIVSGGWDHTVRIWDAQSGRNLVTREQQDEVWDLAASPDGRWIATAGIDRFVYLWDGQTGELIHTLSGHTDTVDAFAFSPDGWHLVSGDNDGILICWQIPDGRRVWTRDTERTAIYSAIYTPDGQRVLTGGVAQVTVWKAATGQFVMSWHAHQHQVFSLDFSPDGRNLLSIGNKDLTFKVWSSLPPG